MTFSSPPPGRPGARAPVGYSPELGRAICARIAAGESARSLARQPGMPSRRTFGDWALREPDFAQALEAAKRAARLSRLAKDRAVDAGRTWRKILNRVAQRGGAPSSYSLERGEAVCARIAAGESVLSIGADPAMPCTVTIYNWVRREAGFQEMYEHARSVAADLMFDLAWDIALETTEETVRADRLRIQTLRWKAAMQAPKKYGARRPLGPDEDEQQPWTVVIQHFADPPPGQPQFTDLEGNPVARPED
jgi:hypothetical protein